MFDRLRKLKPEIHRVGIDPPSPDPRFKKVVTEVPAKVVANTRSDMDLLKLYTHGPLRLEDIGKVCGNCVNYYPDYNLGAHHGRCKAYGYKQVHEELAADDRYNYTDPDGQVTFGFWPGCPMYTTRERVSRR